MLWAEDVYDSNLLSQFSSYISLEENEHSETFFLPVANLNIFLPAVLLRIPYLFFRPLRKVRSVCRVIVCFCHLFVLCCALGSGSDHFN